MSSQRVPKFDYARVTDVGRYNDLTSMEDRMAFINMAMDYVDHIKVNAKSGRNRAKEDSTAKSFVGTVTATNLAWSLARQYVVEFQRPPADTEQLHEPLRTIMDGVAHLLDPPKPVLPDEQRLEEDWLWRKWKRETGYLGSYDGEIKSAAPVRQVEAATVMDNLGKAKGLTPLLPGAPDTAATAVSDDDDTPAAPAAAVGRRKERQVRRYTNADATAKARTPKKKGNSKATTEDKQKSISGWLGGETKRKG